MILSFGKHEGKDLRDVPTDYLMWLIENTDTNHPKFGKKNQALVQACHDALNEKADGRPATPQIRQKTAPVSRPTTQVDKSLIQLRAYIEQIYEAADKARIELDAFESTNTQHSPF